MKIVMFTDAYWPRVNGVTVSVDSFSRALVRAGHQVMIVCSYYPETELRDPRPGAGEGSAAPVIVRVPSLPSFISREDRIAKFSKWFWLSRQVELFEPDLVHINSEFFIAELGFQYALLHNVPAIYTFHTLWEDYIVNYFPWAPAFLLRFIARSIQKTILRRSYRAIVPTVQIQAVVRRYTAKKQTFLVPTGIDAAFFEHDRAEAAWFREKLEESFPALRGRRILLFAGRVAKEKNLGFLFGIMPAILARHPDACLLIVGNGPDLESLKKEASELGIGDHCVFAGYMERKDLALAYMLAEIFVFPSLTETQGLVTLEAMLSGTPVVAIGEMGTIMVMGGDNGGFMVKNDPEEFTRRVLQLMEDRELYEKKAAEAKLHAHSWSIDEITKRLVDVYRQTLESFRAEHGEPRMPLWEVLAQKGTIVKTRWREYTYEIKNKVRPKG
ncbi:MAG: glycosyltransferase [Treponema sp.]|nr:glycosyltransferase [Treponema sp.]